MYNLPDSGFLSHLLIMTKHNNDIILHAIIIAMIPETATAT